MYSNFFTVTTYQKRVNTLALSILIYYYKYVHYYYIMGVGGYVRVFALNIITYLFINKATVLHTC